MVEANLIRFPSPCQHSYRQQPQNFTLNILVHETQPRVTALLIVYLSSQVRRPVHIFVYMKLCPEESLLIIVIAVGDFVSCVVSQ